MTRRGQWLLVAAIVMIAAAGVWTGVMYFGADLKRVTVGARAPDFHAVTLDSAPMSRSLADYRGQVVLLNIWATWCPPCEREMPMLEQLYKDYAAKGLKLVAVSMDAPGMEGPIRDFIKRYGLTFDVLYDADGKIRTDYMTTGAPESFVIGKDGVIRYKQIAAINDRDAAQIRALLDSILAERAN
ncbi:MAG TPA: TlpA disulfide reductase family protein [Gemmatimonadaceae bacterium]|nr:TlpA disulfide reductase family protein [Gemmatimonadaceae bacterium]